MHYAVYAVRVRVKTVSPPQHRPAPLDPLRTSLGPHNTQFGYQRHRFGRERKASVVPSTTIDIAISVQIGDPSSLAKLTLTLQWRTDDRKVGSSYETEGKRKLKLWPSRPKFQPYLRVRQVLREGASHPTGANVTTTSFTLLSTTTNHASHTYK